MRSIWLSVLLLLSISSHAESVLFYQPLNRDASLSEPAWQRILQETRAAGVDTLIVQWTKHGDSDFDGAEGWLMTRLRQAEAMGFKLILGLYYPPDYYARMNEGAHIELLWQQWLAESLNQQQWIREESGLSPQGWYMPMELDDKLLADADDREAVNRRLLILRHKLDSPLHVSAFSAGVLTPDRYAQWLVSLPVSQVWWQDGRGTQALPKDIREAYRQALPCTVGIVAEAFTQTSQGSETFQAQPFEPELLEDCHPQAVFSLRYRPWGTALLDNITGQVDSPEQ